MKNKQKYLQVATSGRIMLGFQVSLQIWQCHCLTCPLTLKAPITTAADDNYKYFFIGFIEKIRLDDVSCDSSARQRIHMKNQALFSSKNKSKKSTCRLLQFLFGALRVNGQINSSFPLCQRLKASGPHFVH